MSQVQIQKPTDLTILRAPLYSECPNCGGPLSKFTDAAQPLYCFKCIKFGPKYGIAGERELITRVAINSDRYGPNEVLKMVGVEKIRTTDFCCECGRIFGEAQRTYKITGARRVCCACYHREGGAPACEVCGMSGPISSGNGDYRCYACWFKEWLKDPNDSVPC